MTFLTRKALTRRTMLKGMGASVALPLLDSMMPALSAQGSGSKQAPMRLGFVYAAHGVIHSEWKPRQTGRQYELPSNLQPLEGVEVEITLGPVRGAPIGICGGVGGFDADRPRQRPALARLPRGNY